MVTAPICTDSSNDITRAQSRAGEWTASFDFDAEDITPATLPNIASTNELSADSSLSLRNSTGAFCCNHQYSITAITTSAGAISERYAYTAYGQPTILNASGTPLSPQTSTLNSRYSYTGREWDATLGLHHFRARWMSPSAGRFLGRDPIGYVGSEMSLSQYCDGNSMRYVDPDGKAITVIGGAVIVGCVAYGGCKIWDANDGSSKGRRPMTGAEAQCIRDAGTAAPKENDVRCNAEIRMGNNLPSPITVCHPMCFPIIGKPIYLGGGDVDCGSCSGFLNTMMTLMHECVHTKQPCSGELSCKEKDAYQKSTESMKRNKAVICAATVTQGKCMSMAECEAAVDAVVQNDDQQLAIETAACDAAKAQTKL
jgi:RHS repeat-associated protein